MKANHRKFSRLWIGLSQTVSPSSEKAEYWDLNGMADWQEWKNAFPIYSFREILCFVCLIREYAIILLIFIVCGCSDRKYISENYNSYWNEYYAERERDKASSVQNLSGKKICEPLRLCLRDCIEKYPSSSWKQYRGRRRDITDFYTYTPVSQCEIYCYQGISCEEK